MPAEPNEENFNSPARGLNERKEKLRCKNSGLEKRKSKIITQSRHVLRAPGEGQLEKDAMGSGPLPRVIWKRKDKSPVITSGKKSSGIIPA